MTDYEVRQSIVKELLRTHKKTSIEKLSETIGVDETIVSNNAQYLIREQHIKGTYADFCYGPYEVWATDGAGAYVVEPDPPKPATVIQVSGEKNIVANGALQISNSQIMNESDLPPEIAEILEKLIADVCSDRLSKKEKEATLKSFFAKLATSVGSPVLAACAVAVVKALLGIG